MLVGSGLSDSASQSGWLGLSSRWFDRNGRIGRDGQAERLRLVDLGSRVIRAGLVERAKLVVASRSVRIGLIGSAGLG